MCVYTFIYTSKGTEYNRVEMKKFQDARAPLNLLKFKLQLKANAQEGFAIFHKELETVVLEQTKFLENLEYQVAVADATDPVQAMHSFHLPPHVGEQRPPSENVLLYIYSPSICTHIYECTYTCTQKSAHLHACSG